MCKLEDLWLFSPRTAPALNSIFQTADTFSLAGNGAELASIASAAAQQQPATTQLAELAAILTEPSTALAPAPAGVETS